MNNIVKKTINSLLKRFYGMIKIEVGYKSVWNVLNKVYSFFNNQYTKRP